MTELRRDRRKKPRFLERERESMCVCVFRLAILLMSEMEGCACHKLASFFRFGR